MTSEIEKSLHQYYHAEGICADHFACPHYEECSSAADYFTTAREASAGEAYLEGTLPRLLFVSLDPGAEDADRHFHVWTEPADTSRWPANRHWYQTHELARELLSPFVEDLTTEAAALYFAHTSAVRCCENRAGSRQARWTLYRNCQPYLRGELERLRPDILVTQGRRAEWAVKKSFDASERPTIETDGLRYRTLPLAEPGPTLWLHTYHASAYGYFWKQKEEEWPKFKSLVRRTFA